MYFDDRRPSDWAVAGWARVTLTRTAPEPVGRLLGLLTALAGYVGVGKSRMEGLGLAGRLEGGSRVRVPCVPWSLPLA